MQTESDSDDFCHTLGKYCRNRDPGQHHDSEPSEHYGESRPTFDLADTSDSDGGQDERPETKYI